MRLFCRIKKPLPDKRGGVTQISRGQKNSRIKMQNAISKSCVTRFHETVTYLFNSFYSIRL
jgi:hypothetical protein